MGPPRKKKYTVLMAIGATHVISLHELELSEVDAWESALDKVMELNPGVRMDHFKMIAIYRGHLQNLAYA